MHRPLQILTLVLIHFCNGGVAAGQNHDIASSSVLSSGKWFRIAVTKDGIYRIDYSRLRQLGLENPSYPQIFSNNAGQLSYYNDGKSPDDLKENSIYIFRGSDGIFNEGDYLLFYGQGTGRWLYDEQASSYSYIRHNYSDTAFYFLTSGSRPGNSIQSRATVSDQANRNSDSHDELYIHGNQSENILHSGREWYQPLGYLKEEHVDPGFGDLVTGEKIKYSMRVLARSPSPTSFRLTENTTEIRTFQVAGVNTGSTTGTYAQPAIVEGEYSSASSPGTFKIAFLNNGEISARGWLDYLVLHGRSYNYFDGKTKFLTDHKTKGTGTVTDFTIAGTTGQASIWDVTDQFSPESVSLTNADGNTIFRAKTDSLRTFVIFTLAGTIIPEINKNPVPAQDLHSSPPADMIIVTHELFLPYTSTLAGLHRNNSGLESLVVTTSQIYNEFSGGIPDLVAIRNFVRMKYLLQKDTGRPLKYLLLFGDGSYNNKVKPPMNPNFVPAYQSQNSHVQISSFTSDDFYGLLDAGEGEDMGTEDIGIGRIPAYDTTTARIAVEKIKRYLNGFWKDDWKNMICMVADDEDGNTHISDAEGLASVIKEKAPWANIDKIYFDSYRQTTTATGQFYPEVNEAINDRINAGCLVFNYVGHGNESSLGHERVVTPETIGTWKNHDRLPLFITATCEFSRFDDITTNIATGAMTGKNSSGENILLKEDGGAVALMSTTRLVYSAPNYVLNRNIFDVAFNRGADRSSLRLGDIIRLAKNSSGSNTNKRNFVLLGDPALRLSWPWQGVVITDSVNGIPVGEYYDTLKALQLVRISGHIETSPGTIADDFNGTISMVLSGKESEMLTLANDGGPVFSYTDNNSILFSGRTKARNGNLSLTFMMPRDMDYSFGTGRISYYGYDEDVEVTGHHPGLKTGGFSSLPGEDQEGPVIRLFMNDTLFREGGITDYTPALLVIIDDENGINISGSAIGHDLIYWLDDDRSNYFILNAYFDYEEGSYTRGTVRYLLPEMSPGPHSITVKAWDNYNNSSEQTIRFTVDESPAFILKNVMNYPNPFSDRTSITAGHNRPGEILDIRIDIFNSSGTMIRTIEETVFSSGYQLHPLEWDGTGGNGAGAGKGLYLYRITAVTRKGETASISGRMIIY